MIRADRRNRTLAVGLAAVAGFVDAVGFIHLGGFFVSFMSGNSTRMVVRATAGDRAQAMEAAGLIGLFVLGVMGGSLLGAVASRRRLVILSVVAVLLAVAAALGTHGHATGAILTMVLAMGAENAVFERDGEVQIGLTYMTGTLVKFGQRLVLALRGDRPLGWLPYLALWTSLVTGAGLGAWAYPIFGLAALYCAAVATALLAVASVWTEDAL